MLSFSIRACILGILMTASAIPLQTRQVQWSFDLYPTKDCTSGGDTHSGSGSTGCRADLSSVASAYRLNTVDQGCTVQFFDNTMCEEESESPDVAGPATSTDVCHLLDSKRRYGSYQVTCVDVRGL
ncbi:hypothetical protein N7495_009911 [Penicillium taxi]|uniref:uncharacterized protein n=1 Tax=Penicillium taxi TaxID=168475 RepID=UPI0025456989|nr:uncharacterized protein N7495_009911 [Penicillium taxi]KAJ5885401.1 hypothetical protein N7495_009911 [Penicillium taxi]